MEKFNQLKALIAAAEKDGEAFYDKGNRAAGTRFRKSLQEIKAAASDLRKDISEKKNKA